MGVGFVASQDGAQTWSAPAQLAGPMKTSWLPNTFSGLMVGDYISNSYVNGRPFGVFAVAKAPSGTLLQESMYTTTSPLLNPAGVARFNSKAERPLANAKPDHGPRKFYDEDGQYPIPPRKRRSLARR